MRNVKIFSICVLSIGVFVFSAFAQFKEIPRKKFSKRTEIRKFDFLNAVYESCAGGKVRTRNGHYAPKNSAGGYFEFDVRVSYGDLTGDGVEEAIVLTLCAGAVQNLDEGKIYAVKNHRLVRLTELRTGTKNDGLIYDAKIKNRRLIVTRGPSPYLCTNAENAARETATFKLLKNNKLQQIGKSICQPL